MFIIRYSILTLLVGYMVMVIINSSISFSKQEYNFNKPTWNIEAYITTFIPLYKWYLFRQSHCSVAVVYMKLTDESYMRHVAFMESHTSFRLSYTTTFDIFSACFMEISFPLVPQYFLQLNSNKEPNNQ